MAKFRITLLTPNGEVIKETVEAENEEEVVSRFLQGENLLIDYKRDWLSLLKDFSLSDLLSPKSISKQELADFCFYMGRSLDMGISILDTLEDIKETSKNRYFKKVLSEIKERITAGSSLSEAMKVSGAFPEELIGLVKLGEETDALPQIFSNYAEYLDWTIRIQKEVKQALAYPIFVTVVMIFTIAIMFGYIIPQVMPAIKALGLKEYPLPTKFLLWSGVFVKAFWKQIIATPIITFILLKLAIKKNRTVNYWYDKLKLKIPLLGDIFEKSSLARDLRAIAEVYRSGGTLLSAVELIINHVETNLFLKEIFQRVKENLITGSMLSEAMERTGYFPHPVIRMVKLGEDTGALDKALLRLAEIYEDDMRRKIQAMTMVIEPTLQVILGAILGVIALGILLPVYNVVSGMGSGY